MNKSRLVIAVLILLVNFGLQAELYSIEEQNDAPRSYSPLNETDISQIKELLAEAKLLPQSLNYEKDWDLSTREKSAWHMNALQKPLTGIEQVGGLREVCADSSDAGLAVTMNHFANIAWGTGDAIEVYAEAYFAYLSLFDAMVKKPKDLFTFWNKVLNGLDSEIAAVYADIPAASLDSLTAFFFTAFAENEDKEKYAQLLSTRKLPNSESLETDALERMFKGINHDFLYISALKYYASTQVMKKGAAKLLYTNRKPLVKLTKHGTMIIGTVIADTYNSYEISALAKSPLCLLIEPAGNDIYEMSLNTSKDYCTYLLIDYSGDDVYRSKTPASMFFSLLGHGISYDIKGDDLYQNDDYTFSSFIGTNLHVDYKGNDTYHSGLFSQGASMQGIAMLVDVTGNDTYTATTLAQGLGSVSAVGALLDYSGADVYQLGGKYFHAPLMPDDYRSMGQGMGFGIRPDFAGGLGLVYDKYGNDKYIGGVYAQGVGYWYSTGVLIDEAGNDVYNAIYYPQGSGIHLACGFLYDGGGNDAYYSRHGPGEGAGHDWGFGALIDASGNDAYSIQGGNGLGLSNSVGIFVDKQGDDRYERNDASNYGNGAFARSTGGIGLFLDMGGKDVYPDSTKINDSTWQKGTYGIGRDIEIYSPAPVAAEVQA
ncbi:MAG: hypothetical protein PHH43_07555, partial [Candidatus Cloacimonetes bacterium]|nr:hypothetical protein [Candidatus Cloacimonadota bacterium]